MKYLFTLLLSFLLLEQTAQAQVPGYMGKRAWFTADLNFAPAFFNMNENHMVIRNGLMEEDARAKGVNLFAINYRPQFSFEYLVGKNIALGLSYSILKTGTVKELETGNSEIDGMYYDIIRGSSFGFHMKKFRFGKSASIAPIGYYWTLGIAASKFNTYASKENRTGQFSSDVINPVLTLGLGKQKVLFDKFLINTGVEYGYSFLPKSTFDVEDYSTVTKPHATSIDHAFASMLGYYLFNIKMSVGMLAF